MTSFSNIDPELRVLLQEVADDPKARLFRTDIPRPERLVLTGVPHTGLRAAGLTNAEREILRVYREDVAKILRDAAEWKIQQDPLGAAKTSVYPTAHRRTHYSDAHELLVMLRSRSDRIAGIRPNAPLASMAHTGESILSSSHATAHQLAGLSLRVVPHDAAWVHVGRTLVLEGLHRPALDAFASVAQRRQTPRIRASALTCLGGVVGSAEDHKSAAELYRLASLVSDPTPNALLSWFGEAVAATEMHMALDAEERIGALLDPGAPATAHWVAQMQRRRALVRTRYMTVEVTHFTQTLRDSVGSTARTVIDALH